MSIANDLQRIEKALTKARQVVSKYSPGEIQAEKKAGGDPVTKADRELDEVLHQCLVQDGDGWLSEETVDDKSRLGKKRVWIVDPLDGTREFIEGIPEWCISIGLAIDGDVVAGGICNPSADELYLGSLETGVTLNGRPVRASEKNDLQNASVLASRSEVRRGEWEGFMNRKLQIVPMGSVAYKLARVSAGLNDITFTLVPKNEWDIAAGVLLVRAAGGKTIEKNGRELRFNRDNTLITGMIASGPNMFENIIKLIETN